MPGAQCQVRVSSSSPTKTNRISEPGETITKKQPEQLVFGSRVLGEAGPQTCRVPTGSARLWPRLPVGFRSLPAGTPAGRGWPGPGAVPLRALTCHGQPRAKASVPGKRPRQTRGHLSGAATVCHAACPEADLQPPAGRQHARSPALGRGPGQALLVPCTQNKHPAFGGFLSLRKKKKKMQIKLTVTIVF